MNDILFGILETAIVAAIAAVIRYLIPFIREKLAQSKYAWIAEIADYAVRAIEQMFKGETGDLKKEYVFNYVKKWAGNHHIKISDDQIDLLIEAAVNEMNTEFGKYDVSNLEGDSR